MSSLAEDRIIGRLDRSRAREEGRIASAARNLAMAEHARSVIAAYPALNDNEHIAWRKHLVRQIRDDLMAMEGATEAATFLDQQAGIAGKGILSAKEARRAEAEGVFRSANDGGVL